MDLTYSTVRWSEGLITVYDYMKEKTVLPFLFSLLSSHRKSHETWCKVLLPLQLLV